MSDQHLYIVTYDISDQKRWRRVFKLLKGYGEWLQLSVFQCRCGLMRYAELLTRLDGEIDHCDDQVLVVDVGDADTIRPKVHSLGKAYAPIERKAIVL
jgi:CRISPR-associated protein Cas2